MTETETKAPVPRTKGGPDRLPTGRFPKGTSGNPLGRVKGTKNKITIARLMLEEVLRDQLTDRGPELMKKAIDMAMGDKKRPGNDRIMRVLLDKMLASPRGEEDTTGGDRDVKVIIENHTGPKTVKPAIDGTSVRISPPKDSD